MALTWRLAAVLQDDADTAILDSYGPERAVHVQEIIGQAVEMGRIICMLDPVEVAARNELMKAAIRDPALALKPPPEPRLGDAGAYVASDPHAGYLSVQGRVRQGGREGLFDDVAGTGWQLLRRGDRHADRSDEVAHEQARRYDIVVGDFGPHGNMTDLDGTYAAWFERLGVDAVLVRPDFYVFGTSSQANIGGLLAAADALLYPGRRASAV